jgi:hypothetical protein
MPEPSRSIILRSSATLAVEAHDYATARQLIAQARRGQPPIDIRWDLDELSDSIPIVHNSRFGFERAPVHSRELFGCCMMQQVMNLEVEHLAGGRYARGEGGTANRWGFEQGYCVIDGQKVPIQRQRLRNRNNQEVRLGSYELFQRPGPLQAAVWDKMMRGLSTRNYGEIAR